MGSFTMGKKNSLWIQKHRKDYYFRLAQQKSYRSRSAFKLLQIAKRHEFIKQGQKIVDLGAAPGGWLCIARNLVGDEGYVLGIDKTPIASFRMENVKTLEMDVNDEHIVDVILKKTNGKVDVLISDLSPAMSGTRSLDNARQTHLAEISFEISKKVLDSHGNFLVKIFDCPEGQHFFKKVKKCFKKTKFIKPEASKRRSAEVYIIGIDIIDPNKNSKSRTLI